jgi:aryl-alcohol dehydrogenase-like predicted oxidoreductase
VKYVRLGSTGLEVSRICLGMMSYGERTERVWHLDEAGADPIVRRAVDRMFARRDDYVLATKVYYPTGPGPNDRGLSRTHIMASIDASLRRLGTDYVDLYQIHRWDHETPIEETMAALHDVIRSGKARYIGASSMYAWQFATAQHVARDAGWTPFVSMQNHYNLIYREEEREMIPLCLDQGIGIIPWSPLARGRLAGSYGRGGERRTVRSGNDEFADSMYVESDFDVIDEVAALAKERDVSPAQVALAWLLGRPGVAAPIVGATKLAHLEDAIAALDVQLTDAETARLERPYQPHAVLGHR